MEPKEVRGAAQLGCRAFGGVVSQVEQVHDAVARRALGPTRAIGAPVRVIHGTIAKIIYSSVRTVGSATGIAAGEVFVLTSGSGRQAGATPLANLGLASLNAVIGDRLDQEGAPLAIRMAVRHGGRDVGASSQKLASIFPDATSKVAVFLHGLAETEGSWRPGGDDAGRVSYGARLKAELGYTPVYLRYNTGRHISDNGRDLARLLTDVTDAWPVGVKELLLIGHSVGGLVIRSACHYGIAASASWVDTVRHVFYLGSPHLGAPLARGAGVLGRVLAKTPETRPFAPAVDGSSAGIKDLRFGYVLEEDWADCADCCIGANCLHNHRHDAPLLSGANHYTISVTITVDASHPVGERVGDLLVQPASAHGRGRRHQHIAFPVEASRQLGGLHHFNLLGHPDIWVEMRGLLDPSIRESLLAGTPPAQ